MKKGIPCFDYYEVGPNKQNRIEFRFASGGREIASEASVVLGDTDPMTGERITDKRVFREYHLQRNREIFCNKKQASVPWTSKEREIRMKLRKETAAEFREVYGYNPDKGTLDWLVNEKMPKQYRIEIDCYYNRDGEYWSDCAPEFADRTAEKAFAAVEGERTLDDFELTLTPIQQDVFRMLRMKSEGINVRGMGKLLAEKWGVDKSDISHAKSTIGRKLLLWLREGEE